MLRSDPEASVGWTEVASAAAGDGAVSRRALLSYERLQEVSPDDVPALYGRCAVCAAMKDRPGFDSAARDLLLEVKDAYAAIVRRGTC